MVGHKFPIVAGCRGQRWWSWHWCYWIVLFLQLHDFFLGALADVYPWTFHLYETEASGKARLHWNHSRRDAFSQNISPTTPRWFWPWTTVQLSSRPPTTGSLSHHLVCLSSHMCSLSCQWLYRVHFSEVASRSGTINFWRTSLEIRGTRRKIWR